MSESTETIPVGTPPADPFIDDSAKLRIGEALGLKDFGEVKKYQHQIERLTQWAKEKGSKDVMDAIWNIKQLANRVGKNPLGQNMAQHLSTYAYLEMERMKLDKQLRELENG